VTHIGNVPDGDDDAAVCRVAEAIVRAFDIAGGDSCHTRLLLENTAGAGTLFGRTFAELGACISTAGLPADKVGMCLDTCHAFAFGYPVDTAHGWDAVIEDIDTAVGLDRLGLIHANDCKFERSANRDRHEWIGDGFIGLGGFEAMVCAPALADIPVVAEMPGEIPEKDIVNVARLKAIRERCWPSQ
jgi:deoxyribonuclease-4